MTKQCEHDEMGIDDSVDCVICYEVKKAISDRNEEIRNKLESIRVGKLRIECQCGQDEEMWSFRLSDLQKLGLDSAGKERDKGSHQPLQIADNLKDNDVSEVVPPETESKKLGLGEEK